jgi:hypothetical protein
MPEVPWEVTNQASVHHWFERYFGHAVEPLQSLYHAVGTWPEYATAVGLRLRSDDTIEIIAPHGLDDLFNCVVRHNPTRASSDTYRMRIMQKRYDLRWPQVKVVNPCRQGQHVGWIVGARLHLHLHLHRHRLFLAEQRHHCRHIDAVDGGLEAAHQFAVELFAGAGFVGRLAQAAAGTGQMLAGVDGLGAQRRRDVGMFAFKYLMQHERQPF